MDEKNLAKIIADNLISYRKLNGFTQAELAEKINYSDKSVSKWERAEGVPDIYVLTMLADIYGVSINDFVSEKKEEPVLPDAKEPKLKTRHKIMLPIISAGLVWLIASIIFFIFKVGFPAVERTWLSFIYAIPISCIVLIIFTNLWWNQISRCISASALVWSVSTCAFLTFPAQNIYFVYVIAGIVQVLIILWYIMLMDLPVTTKFPVNLILHKGKEK